MRLRPTCPLELPSPEPPGSERRRSLASSIGLAARRYRSAVKVIGLPCGSRQLTPVMVFAAPFVRSATARVCVASMQLPVSRAFRRNVTAGEPFALLGHPYPLQYPQSTHAGRPSYTLELTAIGYGNAV